MKISLRDLFWLTLVAALAVGWWVDHHWKAPIEVTGVKGQPGVVMALSSSNQLVEVSVGSDDGLKSGDRMTVYRGSQYVGQIMVRATGPDKCVAQVDDKMRRLKIQRGDTVTWWYQR